MKILNFGRGRKLGKVRSCVLNPTVCSVPLVFKVWSLIHKMVLVFALRWETLDLPIITGCRSCPTNPLIIWDREAFGTGPACCCKRQNEDLYLYTFSKSIVRSVTWSHFCHQVNFKAFCYEYVHLKLCPLTIQHWRLYFTHYKKWPISTCAPGCPGCGARRFMLAGRGVMLGGRGVKVGRVITTRAGGGWNPGTCWPELAAVAMETACWVIWWTMACINSAGRPGICICGRPPRRRKCG